ncbi:MAG TPA: thioredoxin domain-containing protein [Candidatus Saccharimonadales bacterium]|nr:thioredoxin domain-containing protein [Candidatus Saccharimonadales bacterium]
MSLEERVEYAAMKARHKNKLRPWYLKWWGIILLTIIFFFLVFVVASGIYVIKQINQINNGTISTNTEDQLQAYLTAINGEADNSWGPSDASVTIVEFADFSCPYCEASYASVKNIQENYNGRVRIIYRDYPLHDNSIFLALSARCAGEQGKFWQMHDVFFENQTKFNLTQEELNAAIPALAASLGLNTTQFQTCLDSQKYFPKINQDYEDGNYLQIQGTPTWFINNKAFTGVLSEEALQSIVEGLLNIIK